MPAFPASKSDDIAAALTTLPTGTPVSEVAQKLMDLFTSGSLETGTRLPPERQLASTLGVGRSAVREALAALEILGIVDVRPGSGTYLRGTASDLLPQTLRWGLLIGEKNTGELLELRSGLEIFTARLAARRSSSSLKQDLTQALERMKSAIETQDFRKFATADSDFHHFLGEASNNPTVVDLLEVIRALLQVYANRSVDTPDDAVQAVIEHAAILAAITNADEDLAASAMATHMATAADRIKATI